MASWLRGKRGGLFALLLIAALVVGGLGWVTVESLRVEREQQEHVGALARAERDKLRMEHERLATLARAEGEKMRMERERLATLAQAERERELDHKLRLALSLLDSRVLSVLVQEENRPCGHYSAVHPSPLALVYAKDGWRTDTVLEPSPLLNVDLPDWIALHFQADEDGNWGSPQVLSKSLTDRLAKLGVELAPADVERQQARKKLLADLGKYLSPRELLAQVEQRGGRLVAEESTLVHSPQAAEQIAKNNSQLEQRRTDPGRYGTYDDRGQQMSRVQGDVRQEPAKVDANLVARTLPRNGEDWFAGGPLNLSPGGQVSIRRGPMARLWLTAADGQERLLLARLVRVGTKTVCQGVVLDWPRLQKLLADEVAGLFPEARFLPMRDPAPRHPERTLAALPVVLDPGPPGAGAQSAGPGPEPPAAVAPALEVAPEPADIAVSPPRWTPLRVGLGIAWSAALLALAAVGLGGWSLLDLSERRIRFVSAVTHELRTPLTTLRLYLDMLTRGMVQDEGRKAEYLETLHGEADRLNRLIGNVLDFSRLEKQRPRLNKTTVPLAGLLEQVQTTWRRRCRDAEKELVVENPLADTLVETDVELVQQVLGNLIDNACKYSRGADDPRVWLRARADFGGRLALEVEDRGPGVPPAEREAVFRPFHRGRTADVTAGGVGLGLALAQRWAGLLGGRLSFSPGQDGRGACFRVELPLRS